NCGGILLCTPEKVSDMTNSNEDIQAALRRAAECIKSQKFDEARSLIRRVLEQEPNSAPAWYLSSFLVSSADEKVSRLQRAVKADPSYKPAEVALGKLSAGGQSATGLVAEKRASSQRQLQLAAAGGVMLVIVVILGVLLVMRGGPLALLAAPTQTATPTLTLT